MAMIKAKSIKGISQEERMKRVEELRFELVKAKANASKSGTSKARDIKKAIARILTLNSLDGKKAEEKAGRNG